MMTVKRVSLALAAIALTGGCAPLQQAPLVYSSKLVVGLDVSTNATESPGISINIGVKSVDAAYVPVAVSKQTDSTAPMGSATPAIQLIHAAYGEGGPNGDAHESSAANKQKIMAYMDARKLASDAGDRANKEAASKAELDRQRLAATSALQMIDALGPLPTASGLASLNPANAQRDLNDDLQQRGALIQGTLNKQLAAVNDPRIQPLPSGTVELAPVRDRLTALQVDLPARVAQQAQVADAAAADAAAMAAHAEALLTQAARGETTSKTDAMSVYGRFDSNGTAAASSAASGAVLVGKVFSTGLASQNLTEAAKVAAVASCLSAALDSSGAATAADATKMDLTTLIASVCGSRTSR